MMSAVLSNPNHPEYGVATIPFPIPHDQYTYCMNSDISSIGRWESLRSMSSYIWRRHRTPGCGITPKPTPENTSQTALTTGSHTAAAKNAWKPFGMPRRRLGPTLRHWRKTTGEADIAYYFRGRGELRRSLCIRAAQ